MDNPLYDTLDEIAGNIAKGIVAGSPEYDKAKWD